MREQDIMDSTDNNKMSALLEAVGNMADAACRHSLQHWCARRVLVPFAIFESLVSLQSSPPCEICRDVGLIVGKQVDTEPAGPTQGVGEP